MLVKARWDLTEEEEHNLSLDLQDSARKIRRVAKLDSIWGSFSIRHYNCEPESITELLTLQPDEIVRKGDSLTLGARLDLRSTCAVWTLTSHGKVRNSSPEAHLNWLVSQVSGRLPNLRQLQNAGAKTSILLHLKSWSRLQSVELNQQTLLMLARYRIPVRIIVHYQNTDEEY